MSQKTYGFRKRRAQLTSQIDAINILQERLRACTELVHACRLCQRPVLGCILLYNSSSITQMPHQHRSFYKIIEMCQRTITVILRRALNIHSQISIIIKMKALQKPQWTIYSKDTLTPEVYDYGALLRCSVVLATSVYILIYTTIQYFVL